MIIVTVCVIEAFHLLFIPLLQLPEQHHLTAAAACVGNNLLSSGSINILHCLHLLLCELALALLSCCCTLLALKQLLAILVDLELGDDALAGVNADIDCLACTSQSGRAVSGGLQRNVRAPTRCVCLEQPHKIEHFRSPLTFSLVIRSTWMTHFLL